MAQATRVANKRGYKGHGVYIGRGSQWGNPFKITRARSREEAIQQYRQWLWQQVKDGSITKPDLASLRGETLLCYCKPKACHGDVLARAAEWAARTMDEERSQRTLEHNMNFVGMKKETTDD